MCPHVKNKRDVLLEAEPDGFKHLKKKSSLCLESLGEFNVSVMCALTRQFKFCVNTTPDIY